MAFVILSTEIVYESKKCLVKSEADARKRAKKSITYYFAKYYVILGQVIRDTLQVSRITFFRPFITIFKTSL